MRSHYSLIGKSSSHWLSHCDLDLSQNQGFTCCLWPVPLSYISASWPCKHSSYCISLLSPPGLLGDQSPDASPGVCPWCPKAHTVRAKLLLGTQWDFLGLRVHPPQYRPDSHLFHYGGLPIFWAWATLVWSVLALTELQAQGFSHFPSL